MPRETEADRDRRLRARAERLRARSERSGATGERAKAKPAPAQESTSRPRRRKPAPPAPGGRLDSFMQRRLAGIKAQLRGVAITPAPAWPDLAGCLVVLFTARSGSTFLCRELEARHDLGRMGETLNPAQMRRRPLAGALAPRAGRWFGVKAGVQGALAGEIHGFFDRYADRTVYLQLARRDILAQAVSLEKAEQTGRWHPANRARGEPRYDHRAIQSSIQIIADRFWSLRRFAEASGRPWRTVVYEDVSEGDFSSAERACAELGVPRRPADEELPVREVERARDEVNDAWIARFAEEMDAATRELIQRYAASI